MLSMLLLLALALVQLAHSQVPIRSQLQYENFCPESADGAIIATIEEEPDNKNPLSGKIDALAYPAIRPHTFPHAWYPESGVPITYNISDCCHRDYTFWLDEGDFEEYDDAAEADKKGWDPTAFQPRWNTYVFYEPSIYYQEPSSAVLSDPDSFFKLKEVKLAKGPPTKNAILKVYDSLVWLNYTIYADDVYDVSGSHQFNLGLFMDVITFILRAKNDRFWPFPEELWGDAQHTTVMESTTTGIPTRSRPHRLLCTQIDTMNVAVQLLNTEMKGLRIDFVIQVPNATVDFYKQKFEIAMTQQYGIHSRPDVNDPKSTEWKTRYPLGHTATLLSLAVPGVPPGSWLPWYNNIPKLISEIPELNPPAANSTNSSESESESEDEAAEGGTRRKRQAASLQESCEVQISEDYAAGTAGWNMAVSNLTNGSTHIEFNVTCAEARELLRPAPIPCSGNFTQDDSYNFTADCRMAINDTQTCIMRRFPGFFGGDIYCESADGSYVITHPNHTAEFDPSTMVIYREANSIYGPPENYQPTYSITDRVNCEDYYDTCDPCAKNHTQLELLNIVQEAANGGRLCRPLQRYITCERLCGKVSDEEWVGLGFAILFFTLVLGATFLLAMRDKDEIRHLREEPVVTLSANEPVQKAVAGGLDEIPLEPMMDTDIATKDEEGEDDGEYEFDDSYGDGDYQSDDEMTSDSDSDLKSDVDDEPIMKKVQIHF